MTTIRVTNLNPHLQDECINHFFSFCGDISTIHRESKTAFISFSEADSLVTALLLNGTEIEGSHITVEESQNGYLCAETQREPQTEPLDQKAENDVEIFGVAEKTPERDTPTELATEPSPSAGALAIVPSETETPKESPQKAVGPRAQILASLLASGYTIGQEAAQKVSEFDHQHLNVDSKIDDAVAALKTKANDFDDEYQLTRKFDEKFARLKASESWQEASKKIDEVDQAYKISSWVSGIMSDVETFTNTTKVEIEKKKLELEEEKEAKRLEAAKPEPLEIQDSTPEAAPPATESSFFSFLKSLKPPSPRDGQQPAPAEPEKLVETQTEVQPESPPPSMFASLLQSLKAPSSPREPAPTPEPEKPIETQTQAEPIPQPESPPPSMFASLLQSLKAPTSEPVPPTPEATTPATEVAIVPQAQAPASPEPSRLASFFDSIQTEVAMNLSQPDSSSSKVLAFFQSFSEKPIETPSTLVEPATPPLETQSELLALPSPPQTQPLGASLGISAAFPATPTSPGGSGTYPLPGASLGGSLQPGAFPATPGSSLGGPAPPQSPPGYPQSQPPADPNAQIQYGYQLPQQQQEPVVAPTPGQADPPASGSFLSLLQQIGVLREQY